jgi:hypothetical protein
VLDVLVDNKALKPPRPAQPAEYPNATKAGKLPA